MVEKFCDFLVALDPCPKLEDISLCSQYGILVPDSGEGEQGLFTKNQVCVQTCLGSA